MGRDPRAPMCRRLPEWPPSPQNHGSDRLGGSLLIPSSVVSFLDCDIAAIWVRKYALYEMPQEAFAARRAQLDERCKKDDERQPPTGHRGLLSGLEVR
jgi:hypothetical protein